MIVETSGNYADWQVAMNAFTGPTNIMACTLQDGKFAVVSVGQVGGSGTNVVKAIFAVKPSTWDSDFGSFTHAVTVMPEFTE